MKKLVAILCSVSLLMACTSCGGSANDGYNSKEAAAEAYYNIFFSNELSEWWRLMPDDCESSILEKRNLTEEQFRKKLENYYGDMSSNYKGKIDNFKVISSEEQDCTRLNRILNNYGLDKADKSYYVRISFVYENDGEKRDCDSFGFYIYKYKGKWYCENLFDAIILACSW